MSEWLQGFAGASPIEWIATISGFICVYLVIKRNIWCFFFGLIQVSLYSWIFFGVKLYSDMILHLIYIGFQIYGYLIWSSQSANQGPILVIKGTNKETSIAVLIAILGTLIWGSIMHFNTDASLPYFDAFTTATSLVAQLMLSHKRLLNWSFWIVVDCVAIWMYWSKGLYPTSALYFCLLIMAFIGQWQWLKNYRNQQVLND